MISLALASENPARVAYTVVLRAVTPKWATSYHRLKFMRIDFYSALLVFLDTYAATSSCNSTGRSEELNPARFIANSATARQ